MPAGGFLQGLGFRSSSLQVFRVQGFWGLGNRIWPILVFQFWRNFLVLLLLFVVSCVVVCCRVLLCPTPRDPNPQPCLGGQAGPSGPHLFWVWRCCGCCGCCWFGLPWTTLRRTAKNFALLFPSPTTISLFLCHLESVFSLNFGGVFEGQNPQVCPFGLSKRAQFERPGASNTTKNSTSRPPQREKKE